MSRFSRFTSTIALIVCLAPSAFAQPKKKADPAILTLDRIFASGEFEAGRGPALRWRKAGGYVTVDFGKGGQQLVAHDPASDKQEILVPDHWLVPAGENRTLSIEGYEFSQDGSRLLIYTNSKRVWRTNARGDYWVLDLSTRELKKLGGNVPPSSMMFATFSPDGTRVCYVYENNLYVQTLRDLRVTQLTNNGSATIINGTFDWVYEEELYLRNGFRWSPDSKSIAYWQIDQSGVKEFHITSSADGPYTRVISIRYPKTGEQNSSARIGVVSAEGGATTWLNVPGDPREHYLAKMDWLGDAIVLQQFNRLQNTNTVMIADPKSREVRSLLVEKDRAWVENNNDFRWIDKDKKLVWLSERDGWQHVYLVALDGQTTQLTKGAFDVIHIEAIDEKAGWLYFQASPENPTQRYLYRVSLKGGTAERVTPADQAGTHTYSISPDCQWALHSHSRFGQPPTVDMLHLPDHKVINTFTDSGPLKKKLASLKQCPTEMFRIRTAAGVELDGWCIKPPDFDASNKYPVLFYVYGEPAGQTVL
ncbi:MAG TPA: DPP IV N-terminal domain-containing protein, partial [Gemmataceae bacterium]|nr:DPP IV N-terminal domain-containing protein [Gemmataceae bacterium]